MNIQPGKMMRSPAITYQKKVFAFLSQKNKMVFKLGKAFDPSQVEYEIRPFNPFKKRPPLKGWFEVGFTEKEHWLQLTQQALEVIEQTK